MALKNWLWTVSYLSVPRVAWVGLAVLVLLDVLFSHSKNPRIMHLTSAIALLIGNIVKALGIASIPLFGTALMAILNALVGPVAAEPTPVLTPPADPPKAA